MIRPLTKATAELLSPLPIAETERAFVALDKEGVRYIVTFCSYFGGTLCPKSSDEYVNAFIARIPERRQDVNRKNVWTFGGTDITTALFLQVWPEGQVEWSTEAAALRDYWRATVTLQNVCADNYAAWKLSKQVPTHSLEMHADPDRQLKAYQQVAAHNATISEGFGFFMEPGTGKTPTSIVTACTIIRDVWQKEQRPLRIIAIAPKNVRANWEREIHYFRTRDIGVTVLRGDALVRRRKIYERISQIERQANIIVCSYDILWRSWDTIGTIAWDISFLDESHFIKDNQTARCEYAFRLRDITRRRYALTGTEQTNSLMDLWAQLEYLGKGYSGFVGIKTFKEFYGKYIKDEDGHDMLVGSKNVPFLQERLARTSFKITTEEALPDLPPKTYDVIEIELTEAQKDAYEQLRETLAVEIEADLENATVSKQLVVKNSFAKMLRLAEITSGIIRWDATLDENGSLVMPKWVEYFPENPKLEQLVEDIRALKPWAKLITWCCFTPNILQISERLRQEGIDFVTYFGQTKEKDREAAELRFNHDEKCKVFLGNPAAGGIGLNLWGHPKGKGPHKTHCISEKFFSQGWPPTVRWQAEARACRNGTEVSVAMTDYCVLGSIDEQIRISAVEKRIAADSISDLRAVLMAIKTGVLE
jgi:SNF2 family DNA or RNA helicase